MNILYVLNHINLHYLFLLFVSRIRPSGLSLFRIYFWNHESI